VVSGIGTSQHAWNPDWAAAAAQVRPKPEAAQELVADIAGWVRRNYPGGESGIVYVLTRKDAETLAEVRGRPGAAPQRGCTGLRSRANSRQSGRCRGGTGGQQQPPPTLPSGGRGGG
jgi:hypothetical protein